MGQHLETEPVSKAPSPWRPATAAEREAVREELGRILSSALFRNSKRFPAFLRYTVEHALTSTEPLKERTIGHEVFARNPGYDTAEDPVVRMTAVEVRKRLAQYYQRPDHRSELMISYQPGTYVPDFSQPPSAVATPALSAPPVAVAAAPPLPRIHAARWAVTAAAAIAVAVILGAWLVASRPPAPLSSDAAGRFWAPLVTSSDALLLCIGDPARVPDQPDPVQPTPGVDDLTVQEFLRTNSVRYMDAVTLALIASELRARGKPFHIRRPAATRLKDLRDGPVVLIGGLNNPWTLRLSEGLRFTLAADPAGAFVRDRDRPDDRRWRPEASGRLIKNIKQTYGLITRVQDSATGHSVLAVSGLVHGTRAAGECLVDVTCLQSAERLGGVPLDAGNVQIVVAAAVMGEDSGAPRVIAVHSW
ncbi:MAG TPA: hypothetical protein VH458_02380 [Vicinamibacterales bacterium]|jgi:hypothetical protein